MKRKSGETKYHGTREWAVKTVNCYTGCSHDCIYCYAKEMAIRFKQVDPLRWSNEIVRLKEIHKKRPSYDGWIMFPSSHDITPNNLAICEVVLRKLLIAGNEVLIVSKPHFYCIFDICDLFENFKEKILFRFTIGACDDQILSFWEPGAPCFDERLHCLMYAHEAGFQTSVSVEPMLDSTNIDTLIGELLPYVTHSIWIGKMNHLGRFGKGSDMVLRQAIDDIKRGQTDRIIKYIYRRYKDNPMIKWKKEIKNIVGIPLAEKPGMDI